MSPSLRRIPSALIALLVVVSCGSEPTLPVTQGVLHLDPRLPDGSSSAVVLESTRTVIAEWLFNDAEDWPSDWAMDSGVLGVLGGLGPAGGVRLDVTSTNQFAPSLRYLGTPDPAAISSIEVDLSIASAARATAVWNRVKPLESGFSAELSPQTATPQTVHFDLASSPSWSQAITSLVLKMSSNRRQGFELLAIRFLHEPLAWGASPTDRTGGTGGDAGLIDRDGMAVRAWPVSVGAPISERFVVPEGGLLSVQVARSQTSSSVELTGKIAVRVGELQRETTVEMREDFKSWTAMTLDLAEFAGQEVEATFSAVGKTDGELRADVLFGAPLVLGKLPEDRRPNVILVTLDTTRFDAIGSSKAAVAEGGETAAQTDRVHTPALDRFAESSFVFDNAWSAGNSTQPSHASIITGVSIQNHSLTDNFGALADGNVTLAERLRAAGYQTAAVTCQRAISPASGFGQGFDLFIPAEAVSGADGRLAVDDAIEWIQTWAAEGERPFFLWVHVFDPHTPYALPRGYMETYVQKVGAAPPRQVSPATLPRTQTLPPELEFLGDISSRDHVNYLYHAEVAYTDQLMDDLLSTLEETGIADNTLSVITADHGEFLGERGNYYNHRGLFPETLHVPLLLRLPGQIEGRHVPDRVTNRDFVPTVLSALGLIDPPGTRDLVAVATSGADPERRLWFEHANRLQVGCRDAQYHFITVLRDGFKFGVMKAPGPGEKWLPPKLEPEGSVFLYDWTKDPGLIHNLADEQPDLVKKYLGLLDEYRASARPVGREARAVGAEEAAELEALGYTGD